MGALSGVQGVGVQIRCPAPGSQFPAKSVTLLAIDLFLHGIRGDLAAHDALSPYR